VIGRRPNGEKRRSGGTEEGREIVDETAAAADYAPASEAPTERLHVVEPLPAPHRAASLSILSVLAATQVVWLALLAIGLWDLMR
jgi:hypothetical protein